MDNSIIRLAASVCKADYASREGGYSLEKPYSAILVWGTPKGLIFVSISVWKQVENLPILNRNLQVMVFGGNYGNAWTYLLFQFKMKIRGNEYYANLTWIKKSVYAGHVLI